MANEEHLAILKKGIDVWNKWREENPGVVPDLSHAKLSGASFSGVYLSGANLIRADLSNADLREAYLVAVDFRDANLCTANLCRASLIGTNFLKADLSGADLREADLFGSSLRSANLNQVSVTDARFGHTAFDDVDLRSVKGLETAKHFSPSTIGIDTIYRSNGKIPDVFLRGAGVSEDMIGYIHSIAGAVQFCSCFISYSSKDQEFAERLYADLQTKGVRCWFAPHDIQGGKKLHEQIDQAIQIYDKLLLIISKESIQSNWVNTEIYNARQRELNEHRQMFYPVSLIPFADIKNWKSFDADIGKDLGREVREYYIPDFSNWKDHDSYQKAFDRLVNDLKAERRSND
jgi:hypothetical protein